MKLPSLLCSAGLLACPAFLFAQIDGTVINQSTGKPQSGATVGIYTMGNKNGLELVDQAKSDAQGKFTVKENLPGMLLIRTAFGGITYNHRLSPADPRTGLNLEVFDVSKQPGAAKVGKHMILFEPSGEQMSVTETYLMSNEGKTAWYDPDAGTLKVFVPENASKPSVQATAPGGAPIGAATTKTKSDLYSVDFAVKPGETRFDVSYTVPYKDGETFVGKVATKDDNTYLIVPNGIELKADGLNDLGAEPRTQAHIWGLTGNTYKVALTGSVAPAQPEASADGGSDSGPKIEAVMPRLYTKAPFILACALGVLALGLALLYRASPVRGEK